MDEIFENPTPPQGVEVTPSGVGGTGPGDSIPTRPSADPGASARAASPGAGNEGWHWGPPPVVPNEGVARPPRNGHLVLVLLVVVALLAGALGAGLDAALRSSTTSPGAPAATLPNTNATSGSGIPGATSSIARVAAVVEPAVVDIETEIANEVRAGAEQAEGTGMIVTPSGLVLTNNHVVAEATKISVVVAGHGTYGVKVLGVDVTQDVALLQLVGAPTNLPYVSLGDSAKVKVGTPVVAIGNALGLGGKPTVVTGTITAIGRSITASDELSTTTNETLHNLLQTDAPIVSGDSGGPLVDLSGQVIGMDTAAESANPGTGGEGFAIPINEARAITAQIEHGQSTGRIHLGETAFLGVLTGEPNTYSFNPFGFETGPTGTSPSPAGVYVSAVIASAPAAQAGIQAGDTITAIDGTKTTTNNGLLAAIESHKPGASVTVTFVDTSGVSHTVTLSLAAITR
jgi:S1-C subfamily serine protease